MDTNNVNHPENGQPKLASAGIGLTMIAQSPESPEKPPC